MRKSAREQGRRWLEQAEEDLRWAKDLAERGGFHIACFLAQQVGEKALKAFLYAQGEEIVIGHSIERLCRAASFMEPEFRERVKKWSILDGYYVPTRYPNALPDSIPARVYTRDAAQEAVRLAGEAVLFVRDLISEKTKPKRPPRPQKPRRT
jgi:HEPN domain-containing protein